MSHLYPHQILAIDCLEINEYYLPIYVYVSQDTSSFPTKIQVRRVGGEVTEKKTLALCLRWHSLLLARNRREDGRLLT